MSADQRFYFPGRTDGKSKVADRMEQFAALNEYVTSRNGWIISLPGHAEVMIECLPGSALPEDLRGLGYQLRAIHDGERILAGPIVERFVAGPDGELVPITEGSTRQIAGTRTHAGICQVWRFAFNIP